MISGASTQGQTLPMGQQIEIRRGNMQAVLTEVGAGLRSLRVAGREFLDTYPEQESAQAGRGQVLLPWPNRVEDGRYTFQGKAYQLPINELPRNHAIHGFTRWMNWHISQREKDQVTFALTLHVQEGYPFLLALQHTYKLTERGLEIETTAQNVGPTPLPYGIGHHPYFTVGTERVNCATLRLPARSYFQTNERMIPDPKPLPVEGTSYDFRQTRKIGALELDTGFADLERDTDGFARISLSTAQGHPTVTLFLDESYRYVQVFTGDPLPENERRRGLAIEPYTCAANAFNNGLGLQILQPGETTRSLWGITVTL